MKNSCIQNLVVIAFFSASAFIAGIVHAADPLPSWNDGAAKQSIISFVQKVTTEGSPDCVPIPERIAVFDNDGTLWPEYPFPFQLQFIFDELKRRAPSDPAVAADPMVKAALSGDMAKLFAGPQHAGLMRLVALTHTGMTTDEFVATVNAWLATARHPRFNRPYNQLGYQPMLEVLRYMRANGFKIFIVSGGGADFMRVWTENLYGIPPEQVVGSSARTQFQLRDTGPVLLKTLDNPFIDDKEGKPVGIWQNIGRRPIACFGNSDGDQAMLEYTTINNPRPSFGLIVHHTDADREYAYDSDAPISGKLVSALTEALQRGWTVVDMKNDWKTIFIPYEPPVTAIDILLEPDDTMLQHCKADNARLLGVYPNGFALDSTHTPHITMLQCFVRTADLDKVYAAEDAVFASSNITAMKLQAFKRYYAAAGGGLGVGGICAKPTPDIVRLQADIITAASPFNLRAGSIDAFTARHDNPMLDAALVQYVSNFEQNQAGEHFNPHVSTGTATTAYLDGMNAEPFESFEFCPKGAAIFQLGPYGTAAKKLKEWNLK
jgi:phosphoglycolate phosphatase-like HAD superfamily hydrolase